MRHTLKGRQRRAPLWALLFAPVAITAFAAHPAAAEDNDHAPKRLAWFANDPTNTYDNATLAGIKQVANVLGQTVDPYYAGFDINQQLAQCAAAIQSGKYAGMFIESDDAVLIEPCVAAAPKAGIPVVATDLPIGPDPLTVNPQVPGEVGASFIPAGHYATGIKSILPQACQGLSPCNIFYIAGDRSEERRVG